MSESGDLNHLWRDQPVEEPHMTLDEIRTRMRRLETRVGRRNRREYVGAAIVIAGVLGVTAWSATTRTFWQPSDIMILVGMWLVAAGALCIVYHLRRWGSAREMSLALTAEDCLSFHREELVRQRDLLQTVWWWYLAPFVPGSAIFVTARAIQQPDRRIFWFAYAVVFAALFVAGGLLNQRAAGKIQRRIDELDAG